jgi:hypothetical protein
VRGTTLPSSICTGVDTGRSGCAGHELDKRLAAELIEAQPALFLDNANGVTLRSDTLASVLTERPARVRVLGETRMVPLNSTAGSRRLSEDRGPYHPAGIVISRCPGPTPAPRRPNVCPSKVAGF